MSIESTQAPIYSPNSHNLDGGKIADKDVAQYVAEYEDQARDKIRKPLSPKDYHRSQDRIYGPSSEKEVLNTASYDAENTLSNIQEIFGSEALKNELRLAPDAETVNIFTNMPSKKNVEAHLNLGKEEYRVHMDEDGGHVSSIFERPIEEMHYKQLIESFSPAEYEKLFGAREGQMGLLYHYSKIGKEIKKEMESCETLISILAEQDIAPETIREVYTAYAYSFRSKYELLRKLANEVHTAMLENTEQISVLGKRLDEALGGYVENNKE